MQETERYKLKKPDADDFFDIEDFNENTDKIEQALKENAEGVKELKAPSFDDSGTVDGINSFTDFLNSVKNKMNIFQFFKNFKAGMKFILHTGMIVDNYATKEKGFIPDATLVTSLKEQLDEQNNNIINNIINNFQIMQHRPYNSTALNEFNIDNFAGNWIAGFTDVGEGTFPEKRWQNIVQFDTGHFENQISMQSSFGNGYLPEIHLRSKYAGGENQSWTNWNKIVTNSDLPIFQSFIVDPQGSDRIVLTLTNNADSGKVFATNGDVTAFNGYIKGVQIEHNTNKLTVFLSENRAGNIRINVMYMKL